jgi:prophage maintenance system killer protein
VLKDYLVKGYALNQQRLEGKLEQAADYLQILIGPLSKGELSSKEQQGFLELIARYSKTMVLLNRFDEGRLSEEGKKEPEYAITTEDALEMVALLKADLIQKKEASELFGNQKDRSFDGVIGAVNQTVFGEEAYPTVEAKAAHLLYFIIKNHPFSDGNKRIGAFLFAWYLERNSYHLHRGSELKINENALAAIALLVALSDPRDKDMLLKLIMGLVD